MLPNPIPAGHLHLWVCQNSNLSPQYLDQAKSLFLTEEEHARHQRFKFPQHQKAFLASRILLKTGLQAYLNMAPADMYFDYNAYGKPQLNPAINPFGLHFNLSHSADFTVLALHHHPVGVDTEKLDRRTDILNIARHNFHPREVAQLGAAQNSSLGFYFWMLKEAYIKYIGKGLSQNLQEFYFEINQEQLVFGFEQQPGTTVGAALLNIGSVCTAAVCHTPGPVHWYAREVQDFGLIKETSVSILAQTPLKNIS